MYKRQDFNDYLTSMEQMNKMGGFGSILSMLPGVGSKVKELEGMIDEKAMDRTKSIILSMTAQERSNPSIPVSYTHLDVYKRQGILNR